MEYERQTKEVVIGDEVVTYEKHLVEDDRPFEGYYLIDKWVEIGRRPVLRVLEGGK